MICGNFMAKERALRVNCDSAGEVVIKERAKACAEMREEAKVKKWPLRRQIKTWNGARQKKKKKRDWEREVSLQVVNLNGQNSV